MYKTNTHKNTIINTFCYALLCGVDKMLCFTGANVQIF